MLQVVLGREYKGKGFLPAPTTVNFVDFTVGTPMTVRFTMTNVSLSFNSFKSAWLLQWPCHRFLRYPGC
jgi:hypothetical protein